MVQQLHSHLHSDPLVFQIETGSKPPHRPLIPNRCTHSTGTRTTTSFTRATLHKVRGNGGRDSLHRRRTHGHFEHHPVRVRVMRCRAPCKRARAASPWVWVSPTAVRTSAQWTGSICTARTCFWECSPATTQAASHSSAETHVRSVRGHTRTVKSEALSRSPRGGRYSAIAAVKLEPVGVDGSYCTTDATSGEATAHAQHAACGVHKLAKIQSVHICAALTMS